MHPLSVAFDREQTIHDHEREENARVPIIKFTILVTKCLSFLAHVSVIIPKPLKREAHQVEEEMRAIIESRERSFMMGRKNRHFAPLIQVSKAGAIDERFGDVFGDWKK
jgi:hypothetical protein